MVGWKRGVIVIVLIVGLTFLVHTNLGNYNVLQDHELPTFNFDIFTGLSKAEVFGASGKSFTGGKCRAWSGLQRIVWPEPRAERQNQGVLCENWVVITTINAPTQTILTVDSWEGWCTVVVLDRKTPVREYLTLNRSVVLSVEDQLIFIENLGLDSAKRIPWNHFGRKNVGYLYAMTHGAKVIYDTDDDNIPLKNISLEEENIEHFEVSEAQYNIYSHFKTETSPRVWPRGFPLDQIHTKPEIKSSKTTKNSKIVVSQYLANHDPDVDAIYRLTSQLPIEFSSEKPGISLSPETFSPYNAQATLHHQKAFFALLLPITVHGRVSDIWRSYFAQKLFWITGYRVSFLPPLVIQKRNVHNYLADFDSEIPLYIKTGQLITLLNDWKSSKSDIREVMYDLAVEMYENCYWEEEDVRLIQDWLVDLSNLGYQFPPVLIL